MRVCQLSRWGHNDFYLIFEAFFLSRTQIWDTRRGPFRWLFLKPAAVAVSLLPRFSAFDLLTPRFGFCESIPTSLPFSPNDGAKDLLWRGSTEQRLKTFFIFYEWKFSGTACDQRLEAVLCCMREESQRPRSKGEGGGGQGSIAFISCVQPLFVSWHLEKPTMRGNISARSSEPSGDNSFNEQRCAWYVCTYVRYPHTHLLTIKGIDKWKTSVPLAGCIWCPSPGTWVWNETTCQFSSSVSRTSGSKYTFVVGS